MKALHIFSHVKSEETVAGKDPKGIWWGQDFLKPRAEVSRQKIANLHAEVLTDSSVVLHGKWRLKSLHLWGRCGSDCSFANKISWKVQAAELATLSSLEFSPLSWLGNSLLPQPQLNVRAQLSFNMMKYAFMHSCPGSWKPLYCTAALVSPCPSWVGELCQVSFAQELLEQQYLCHVLGPASASTACAPLLCTLIPCTHFPLPTIQGQPVPTLTYVYDAARWIALQAHKFARGI